MAEIKRIEKEVSKLLTMIQELSSIIKQQTEVVNSIECNVVEIQDFVNDAVTNIEDTHKLMTSANEKLYCLFIFMVIFACWIVNKLLGSIK